MSVRYDCGEAVARTAGVAEAAAAVRKGDLAVIPTDTVYGVAADAFSPAAVADLLAAKGRGRQMPPPVLVGSVRAATALVEDVGVFGKDLIDEFWPGALTLVFRASRSLAWDLGDTKGTVAVRMPLHPVALEVLKETGPLAVSSANRSGQAPAATAEEAERQLGDAVAVYLDGGPCPGETPSTIVDLTGPVPRLLRAGAIPVEAIRGVVTLIADDEESPDGGDSDPDGAGDGSPDGGDSAPDGAGDGSPDGGDSDPDGAGDGSPEDDDGAGRGREGQDVPEGGSAPRSR